LKGLGKRILDFCAQSEIIPITRTIPKSREALFELLKSSHGLISFDEFSAINLEAASLGIPVFLVNPLFENRCRQNFSVSRFQSMICLDADEFLRMVSLGLQQKLSPLGLEDLVGSNTATLANWKLLLEDPAKFSAHMVTPRALCDFQRYTRSLKRRRIISIHFGGQAGSGWLASNYVAAISAGKIRPMLSVCARMLDYTYICFGPFLIVLERLPILRCLIVKVRKQRLLPSYKSGQAIYSLQ
jgi:hypothetical protein